MALIPKPPLSTNLSNESRLSGQALVNKMDKEHFTIQPGLGFGLLRFDMSVAEAKSFANIYGKIEADGPLYSDEGWQLSEKMFRDMGRTEERIAEIKQAYMEMRGDQYSFSFADNVVLFFEKDRLREIRLGNYDLPAFLGEKDVFSMSGEPVIRYIAEHLHENPRVTDDGMFFLSSRLSLSGYFTEVENGQIKWKGQPPARGERGIFLANSESEPRFDPETTFIYKVIK